LSGRAFQEREKQGCFSRSPPGTDSRAVLKRPPGQGFHRPQSKPLFNAANEATPPRSRCHDASLVTALSFAQEHVDSAAAAGDGTGEPDREPPVGALRPRVAAVLGHGAARAGAATLAVHDAYAAHVPLQAIPTNSRSAAFASAPVMPCRSISASTT